MSNKRHLSPENDWELVQAIFDLFMIPYKAEKDLSGNPYWIVERVKPDRCPPKRGHSYYAWGMHFDPNGRFVETMWINIQ